ncbi:MAG: hypothetical protein A3B37_02415 [Candidatus Sungbacteria bacterium RIFCSPLOWO2_01_FULL_59_16]|uniref:ATP synthase subunit b n=1 Tax=Candidatus Sungbacteria bacterium RIFCSPLOWO2_01_FULL_59_16 TaxID=1802280 RepID=A0A1G2LCN2_9BACT|nr:MAG: hypothetical protein A3B37_02415 [Candidatus Sungbacteria bacterium RIFCSPLOWO2_01_FULL_59_16]
MADLFHQLGIDWRLLLAQGVNFFVVLAVLTALVYRPLLRLLAERRARIEFGLKGAAEAERRLKEIDMERTARIAAADREAVAIVGEAEQTARHRVEAIVDDANQKSEDILKNAASTAEHQRLQALDALAGEAHELIRAAIGKTVELDPKTIDEKLIHDALTAVRR